MGFGEGGAGAVAGAAVVEVPGVFGDGSDLAGHRGGEGDRLFGCWRSRVDGEEVDQGFAGWGRYDRGCRNAFADRFVHRALDIGQGHGAAKILADGSFRDEIDSPVRPG